MPEKDDRVYLHLEEDQDLVHAVEICSEMEGCEYLGLGRGLAVFRVSTDSDEFLSMLLDRGVRILSAIVRDKGGTTIGRQPMFVRCKKCQKRFPISKIFSRSGEHLCDGCMSKMIESGV